MPLAYFLTFSTYGTWLHGTEKGNGSVDRNHNVFGTPFIIPDKEREELAMQRMTGLPYVLNESARTVVRDAIVEHCKEKNWRLSALHVRSNHVHAVVSAERDPGRLMSDLKARASRELNRANIDANEKRWTRHGSTRYLFDEASVVAAVRYTLDEQGPPMAIFDARIQAEQEPAHEVHGTHGAAHEVSEMIPSSGASKNKPAHESPDQSTCRPIDGRMVFAETRESPGNSDAGTSESKEYTLTSCAAPFPGSPEVKAYEE